MSNTTLQPLTIHPWVYVLTCAPRDGTNYPTLYVGATLNAHQRITHASASDDFAKLADCEAAWLLAHIHW